GLGEPVALSAEHGEGTSDLYAALKQVAETTAEAAGSDSRPAEVAGRRRQRDDLTDTDEDDEDDRDDDQLGPERPLRVAIVGRPNAGKSTIINKLVGEERLLTGPEAGITRDSISV